MSNPWDSFNPTNIMHVFSLQTKLQKHVLNEDGTRCFAYIVLLFKHWTREEFQADDDGMIICPIDKQLVNDALRLAKQWKNK